MMGTWHTYRLFWHRGFLQTLWQKGFVKKFHGGFLKTAWNWGYLNIVWHMVKI